ncbi:PepSY domain-containing protein [Gallibacterium melopsittaci]|uniref:PepSY domain-containing protein n=1 Tax=Gallibacterium melopsittaci TaxID=516063 RepID=A0ABV6HW30_9PAST
MTKLTSKLIAVSSIALFSLGPVPYVFASDNNPPPPPTEFQQHLEQAVGASKITLPQAIEIAQQKVGGTALEAEFHPRKQGNPIYDVEILTKEKQIKEIRIDAVTSEILRNEVKQQEPHHHRKHKD